MYPNMKKSYSENEKTKRILDYSFKGEPVNEFSTNYLATYCFPVLFPTANGHLTRKDIKYNVKWFESIKHLLRYSYIIDNKIYYPFSEKKLFIFWAYNLIEIHRLLNQTKVFLSREIDISEMTREKISEILENPVKTKNFIEKCLNYTANVRGNASYWHSVKGLLQNMVEQKGCPNIFFTFSSAEAYWPDLIKLYDSRMPKIWLDKMILLQKKTSLIDWYFMQRFDIFIKILFDKIYPSEWFWYRIEFQHRGTIHIHGFIKLILDFDLNKMVSDVLNFHKLSLSNQLSPSDKIIWKCKENKLTNLIDKYIMTQWPSHFKDNMIDNFDHSSHPCELALDQINHRCMSSYYKSIVDKCCRHTICSEQYCLRVKNKNKICRFGFPKSINEKTSLIYNRNNIGQYFLNYEIKRGDSLVNTHNVFQLLGWRANVDMQFIFSETHVVEYLTKYVTKSESTSLGLETLIKKLLNEDNERSFSNVIKSSILKKVGGRDVGLMECTHILMGLPLYKSSLDYISVNLYDSQELNLIKNSNSDNLIKKTIIYFYKKRPEKQIQLNLYDFITKYYVCNNKLAKRKNFSSNKVIKFSPNYIYVKNTPNYFKYCLLQLIKFRPWCDSKYQFKKSYSENEQILLIHEWEEFSIKNTKYVNYGLYSDDKKEKPNLIGTDQVPSEQNIFENDNVLSVINRQNEQDYENYVDLNEEISKELIKTSQINNKAIDPVRQQHYKK